VEQVDATPVTGTSPVIGSSRLSERIESSTLAFDLSFSYGCADFCLANCLRTGYYKLAALTF
jgi:hypothetical protein